MDAAESEGSDATASGRGGSGRLLVVLEATLIGWIVLVGVLFFRQYLPVLETGLNVLRRVLGLS